MQTARFSDRSSNSRRSGFTLIELLVVISIIALLIGLLLPSLGSARDNGRTLKCMAQLKQFGTAFQSYANGNRGVFSSGPWDNSLGESYGDLFTTGWVADMVNGEYALPGNMLCPTSPARSTQSLNIQRANGSAYRTVLQSDIEDLVNRGFNTNYCQTWYMAHTDVKDHRQGSQFKDRTKLVGPLAEKSLTHASPSTVPMIADGAALLGEDEIDPVIIKGQQTAGAKSLTDGPVSAFGLPGGVRTGRQRYEDLGPAHGKGGKVVDGVVDHDRMIGNILFADGSVKQFQDTGRRDGRWDGLSATKNGVTALLYDELEDKVYGGWLTRAGSLNW
jgi:prepilin-type N-terminal cleavage/methylation domain-containing protein/prepilin-type processing-associated H-X9-DG protein